MHCRPCPVDYPPGPRPGNWQTLQLYLSIMELLDAKLEETRRQLSTIKPSMNIGRKILQVLSWKRFNIYSQLGNKLRQELDQALICDYIHTGKNTSSCKRTVIIQIIRKLTSHAARSQWIRQEWCLALSFQTIGHLSFFTLQMNGDITLISNCYKSEVLHSNLDQIGQTSYFRIA